MTLEFDQASWNARYLEHSKIWSGNPNPQLVAEASGFGPGKALDAGSGEGADAIWLAQRGWAVTAVDISDVALARAGEHAAAAGVPAGSIDWECRDLTIWVPPALTYELVSVQFMHLPPELRDPLFARLAAAVSPGGTLLIVGHHPSDMQQHAVHRPPMPERFYTAEDVVALLDPETWETLVCDARPRTVKDAAGQDATIRDTVVRVRRRTNDGDQT